MSCWGWMGTLTPDHLVLVDASSCSAADKLLNKHNLGIVEIIYQINVIALVGCVRSKLLSLKLIDLIYSAETCI